MIRIGPVGSTGGHGIYYWDDRGKEKIVQIFIAHGKWIYSLQYLYVDQNGNLVLSDSHGTADSYETSKFDVVKLDYPSEFITGISGCHGHFSNNSCKQILSITFTTNKRTYGPFGGPGGTDGEYDSAFRYQLGLDRPFGGFHGYSGHYLEAIGLYVKPLTTLSNDQEKVKNEKV